MPDKRRIFNEKRNNNETEIKIRIGFTIYFDGDGWDNYRVLVGFVWNVCC